jgi:ATP:corrinoid adenosyltransferase
MPRCFPAEPDFAEERRAERAVWEALRDQLPDEAALFHSVALLEGEREQEIDLLVAWPGLGLAAIEVKGGHVTRDGDGWHQESRGQKRKIGSPVLQAQDGKKVLTRYLQQHSTTSAGRARAAHLVALPFTTVPTEFSAPDLPRTTMVAKDDLPTCADVVRRSIEEHGAGHQPLDDQGLQALVDLLAGQLVGQTSLLSAAEEHEQRVEQMTRDQLKTLENLAYHRRLKVIGGAGTGKTWLALEQARRLAAKGERVALVCYSRGLARYFERVTATWKRREQPAFVGLFHQLPVEWGAAPGTDDSDDFEVRLPRELGELAAARPAADRFDSIVVDEAQDFGELWWPSMLACLADQEQGGLFVFMDEAQRVFSRHGVVPIDLPPYLLNENIRNTKRIAQLFSSLSGEALRPRGLEGPQVRLLECPTDDVIGCADDAVDALLDEGWEPGQVVLLTTHHRHPEQRNAVDVGGWAAYWDDFFAAEDVFYGHVLGFKGLERSVAVLAVNGFKDVDRAREMLYVGLSRARTLLVVVGEQALLEQVGGDGVRARMKQSQRWRPSM